MSYKPKRGKSHGHVYWTKERVLRALWKFYEREGRVLLNMHEWHEIVKGTGMMRQREYPSTYAVLKHFKSFRQAWTAAGVQVNRSEEPYSEDEEWFLREAVGIYSRKEIAEFLRRTEGSIKRRLYDLGIDARTRWGWTIHRVSEHTQIPGHLFDGYLLRGELPYFRGNKFIYLDPADLLEIDLIDWRLVTRDLKAAARKSLMWRAAMIIAGKNWRAARPQQPHNERKTTRVYNWKKKHERAPAPQVVFKRNTVIEVIQSPPGREIAVGRRGVVHLMHFVRQGGGSRYREAGWRVRVEFKKQKSRGSQAKRVIYSLPVECVRRVHRRTDDPLIPETALNYSAARRQSIADAVSRKSKRLKRNSTLRQERLEAERRRIAKRENRKERAKLFEEVKGTPFRGRQTGKEVKL